MSIHDRHLTFSLDQAVTVTAISTDVYDSSPFGVVTPVVAGPDLGTGNTMDLVVVVTTLLADAGSDATVTVTLVSDSTSNLATSPTTHLTLPLFPAAAAVGTIRRATLPPGQTWERYVGLVYTVSADGPLTGGAFTAFICPKAAVPNTAAKYASALNFA